MRNTACVASLVAVVICTHSLVGASVGPPRRSVEFVGTTPCDTEPRMFMGRLASGAPCDAITWRLSLVTDGSAPRMWKLSAAYKVPAQGRPGQSVDGPHMVLAGTVEVTRGTGSNATLTVYRLATPLHRRLLHFAQIGDDLLHLLSPDGSLMVGNSGWSYTLNRADRAEKTGSDAPAPDMSYPVPARATGPLFGVFEGRTPCRGIARELNLQPIAGCIKVKWRITLNRNSRTGAPTTYKVEGSLYRQRAREGTWSILRGTATSPSAVVYRLDATRTEAALHLLKGDDNVVFVLDRQQRPMIGNADYSYTLHRVPGT